MNKILLILVLLLTGCAADFDIPFDHVSDTPVDTGPAGPCKGGGDTPGWLDFTIDEDFSEEERQLTLEAIHSWNVATGFGLNLLVLDRGGLPINKLEECVPGGLGKCRDTRTEFGIYMYPNCYSSSVFYQVMLHEVGHAFGLKHEREKESIMSPGTGDPNHVPCITQNDAENALRVWHLPTGDATGQCGGGVQ
jgi:hypothetical protein